MLHDAFAVEVFEATAGQPPFTDGPPSLTLLAGGRYLACCVPAVGARRVMADDMREELLGRIAARRATIDRYLGDVRPRSGRLSTVSIISSVIAGIFVAGPAAGGATFTDGVAKALSLETGSDVWRPLCLLALIANGVALITTGLHKSQDLSARVSAAEACDAELEGLQVLLQFDRLSTDDAVDLYQRCVARIPFVD